MFPKKAQREETLQFQLVKLRPPTHTHLHVSSVLSGTRMQPGWQAGQQENTDHSFCHLLAASHHQYWALMPGGPAWASVRCREVKTASAAQPTIYAGLHQPAAA